MSVSLRSKVSSSHVSSYSLQEGPWRLFDIRTFGCNTSKQASFSEVKHYVGLKEFQRARFLKKKEKKKERNNWLVHSSSWQSSCFQTYFLRRRIVFQNPVCTRFLRLWPSGSLTVKTWPTSSRRNTECLVLTSSHTVCIHPCHFCPFGYYITDNHFFFYSIPRRIVPHCRQQCLDHRGQCVF